MTRRPSQVLYAVTQITPQEKAWDEKYEWSDKDSIFGS